MNRLLKRIVFFFAGSQKTEDGSTSVFGLLTSNLLFCYTIALLSSLPLAAQNTTSKGDRYFDKNLFQEAIKYYQSDIKSGRKKTLDHAMLRLADCYRIIGEFELAEVAYQKILKKKKNKENPLSYLNYGQSLKSSAKFAEAKIQFEEYIKMKPDDPMGKVLLASCDSAQLWLEQTIGKEVMNMEKINTNLSDFSPIILNSNELVFTAVHSDSKKAFISFNGGLEVNKLDIYSINMNDLSPQKNIKPTNLKELNSIFHEGTATFNSSGNQVYFTRTVKGKRDKNTNQILSTLQIFYSIKDSLGKWSFPVSAFNFNSDKYSVGHPSLSKDENFLFFISDMPGGYGQTDIYYLEKREDGSWTEPANAGNKVNTFGHELFPYIADNGILYFSSDAHPGMGQLDIFSAQYKNLPAGKVGKKWTNVANLKPPINSIGNDFGIVFDEDCFRGFFSSDRFDGKGSEDIYSFSGDCPSNIILQGKTLKIEDKSYFDLMEYKLIDETTQNVTELIAENGWFSTELDEEKNYTIYVRKNRMPYDKIKVRVKELSEKNQLKAVIKSVSKDIILDGKLVKQNITVLKPLPAKFIHLDFDKDRIISVKELTNAIDLFFDGDNRLLEKDLNDLIDFFYEQ